MQPLPTTLLSLILSISATHASSATNPIYLTNYTTAPALSLSLTPSTFFTVPGLNGTYPITAQALLSPLSKTTYPFSIAVRDFQNVKKPHFSTTQTLVWINASTIDASGVNDQKVVQGWDNCLLFFTNVSASANSAGQGDDGSCGETLGSACVGDLEMAVRRNSTTGGRCEDLFVETLPASCEGKLGVEVVAANLTYNNQSYYPLLEVQTPLHRWDNSTYLQVASETLWPFVWWQSLNAVGDTMFNGSIFVNATARTMGCLRATTRYNATTSEASELAGMGGGRQWVVVAGLAVWTAWNLS
ncbi:uncharacterized protein LY89DRAFT_678798 [Mollisia scopiformis]|uniref:Uncharacterized protein n=1 Tax=Mollisia scopiformis TaxID=149040 RepID=A0A132B240_MOLSC|nr:uncharacterized protein LY89DRAFT_678798 [Mollisia scopiformis]KUJ06381.1 hypothetical protein LY89DRAFT_678798 [Mollisia scopiformis]